MKRNLVLEYRIRKLEKVLLEDSLDDELDTMSDEILKNNTYNDIEDDLNNRVSNIIKQDKEFKNKNKYGDKFEFDTVEDWIDHIAFMTELNEFPELYYNGDVVKKLQGYLDTVSILNKGGATGLSNVFHLRDCIKELDGMNAFVAQQKLVNALRKRIRLLKSGEWIS